MDAPVYCIRCGATIPTGAAFCPTCGESQSGAATQAHATGPGAVRAAPPVVAGSDRRNWAPIFFLVVVLAAAGAGFYLWQRSMNPPLSYAETVWCRTSGNGAALSDAADRLGIDKTDLLLVILYEQQGLTPGSKIKAEYARVCDAAYSSR